jgi:Fe-S-cluster containining protein
MREGNGCARIRIVLQTPDWSVEASLSVPTEPAPIEVWLPFLHAFANKAGQSAEEAVERAGKRISCKKGCGACCRQLVAISLVEAKALAQLVANMPEPRQSEIRDRFAKAARRFEIGVLERDISADQNSVEFPLIESDHQRMGAAWFNLQIACPFLENESCSIHESRPLVCREYLVTSPSEGCSRLYREAVERVETSVHLGQSLARATAEITGLPVAMVPIMMALQWSEKIETALSGRHDAVRMLEILLGEIGDWRIEKQ